MASTTPSQPETHTPETTFKSYTATQAASYATHRGTYTPALVSHILTHHLSTGGGRGRVLDLGTGHGSVVRAFAPHFREAVGVDPAVEMVTEAERICTVEGVRTAEGEEVRFLVGAAEECDRLEGLEGEGCVNLLVAGMAAHWFHMPTFWATAAKLVKPGGTVALWTCAGLWVHPTQPHAATLQSHLTHFEEVTLAPWATPGNKLTTAGYTTLPLPHALPPAHPAHAAFPAAGHTRKDWNYRGECGLEEEFFQGSADEGLQELSESLGTASMVTRWRGDPQNEGREDVVAGLVRELAAVAGGDVRLKLGSWTALVMCKRG